VSTVKHRVAAALGANAFGQGVNVAIQLFALPLFLSRWDAATYGVWLMLSALPGYLAMADVGMVTAAGNRMTMAMGRGDSTEASRVFQSALVFMAAVCAAIAMLTFPLIAVVPDTWLPSMDARTALAALSATVLLVLFSGLADAVFRATGRYASGTMLSNLLRLAEWAGSMVGLLWIGSFTAVAVGALLVRAAGLVVLVEMSRRGEHGLRWSWLQASAAEVRQMMKPALSFMVFPLANALSFQGVTLLVGHLFGPAAVALFNTYRTLARVAVQVTGIFSHSLWPEFSRLYGAGGADAVQRFYSRTATTGSALAVGLSVVLYLAGPWLLQVWTHGAIPFRPGFMLLMLAYACVGGLWHVPRVLLMATNQHVQLAGVALVSAIALLVLTYVLGHVVGLLGVGFSMLLAELGIAMACLWFARQLLVDGRVHAAPRPA
jgi:O-antigen/teichoic acid export membrane protein